MVLSGIEIRSALELEVPVSDIFSVNIAPEGNILAKYFHDSENKKDKKLFQEVCDTIDKNEFINYTDIKIINKLSNDLNCYVYDSYFVFEDEFNNNKIKVEKTTELMFVNTEYLNFDQFCNNFMLAQSFTGNFKKPEFNFPFIGVGNFDLEDYIPLHNLAAFSNINLINFYVYHKNILSSIGYFICGLFENDIKDQKKYITDQEYKSLISLVKRQKKSLMNVFNKPFDDEIPEF